MRPLYGLLALGLFATLTINVLMANFTIEACLLALVLSTFSIVKFGEGDFNFKAISTCVMALLALDLIGSFFIGHFFKPVMGNFAVNTMFFTMHLTLDAAAIYFIKNRAPLLLKLYGKNETNRSKILKHSYADAPLYGIFIMFCLVDFLALTENFIRNLEKFGVAEKVASQYWSWLFFFNNYELLKAILLGLMFMTLFACAYIANKQSKRMETQGAV